MVDKNIYIWVEWVNDFSAFEWICALYARSRLDETDYNRCVDDGRARVFYSYATAAAATAHAHHYVMAQNASELARNKTKVSTISNEY